jgi:peptidoglycan/xylan/chitin deacetylase (PgdA/CDA1 family)
VIANRVLAAIVGLTIVVAAPAVGGARGPRLRDRASAQAVPPQATNAQAATTPSRPVVASVISHGSRLDKRVALTFDACSIDPPGVFDARIAAILREHQAAATFFLGGKWMEEHPADTKSLAANPRFELATHAYTHPHLTRLRDDQVLDQLQRAQAVLLSLTGRSGTLYRPPYGESNARVAALAAGMGLTTVLFDLASGDPDPTITAAKLIAYVPQVAKRGAIVVMHINGRGWHTADALPDIIKRLRARGLELVTVSEMLADAAGR